MPQHSDDPLRRIDALQQRFSALCGAFQRVNASLDLGTVLQEIVETARTLTGSRYGLITTVDDSGQPRDLVTAGFTPEERQQLLDWPEGPRLFEHLRDLPGAMRLRDFPAYLRSLGIPTDPFLNRTLQGTPLRHRQAHLGTFFLAEKEGGLDFTDEDEEVLLLFASQAATAIVNARTYRNEQRARADLEALIDTSPVGVVVFNARTGQPESINREARRIVEPLRQPDQPAEQLLQGATCQRADGREVALGEMSLPEQLSSGETVRAEQIVISVADGRSARMLVNGTPIRGADGEVESVVVTMQDLAPLEELERMRADFIGMVSHELRAPLMSIKGSTTTALSASLTPNPAETLPFFRVIDEQADHMIGLIADLLDQGRIEAGTLSVSPEPAEVAGLVDQARKTLLSSGIRHTVRVDLPEDLPRVMADRQRVVQVLNNLFSNAARHSRGSSPIHVSAVRDGMSVAVSVADQGRGVPPDRLPHLFRKHAETAGGAQTGQDGFGLGLLICRGLVEAHGGRIWAESAGVGHGTRITFTVPVAEGVGGTAATPGNGRPLLPGRQEGQRAQVLVVDDDPQMLRYFRDVLMAEGYAPIVTGDPNEVASLVRTKRPALVILDLRLPEVDGIELMEQTPELADLPVIFISAYGRDETIARALDSGAADYIVKPFSRIELTARVRAALRRHGESEPFVFGKLAIAYDERRVTVAGRPVKLTATEYELLRVLSLNAGGVVTYDALLRQAWGRHWRNSPDRKLVQAVVKRLRRKLGDEAATPTYILSERGVGYRMPRPDDSSGGST